MPESLSPMQIAARSSADQADPPPPSSGADARFEELTTEFLAAQYAARPVMATAMGVSDYDAHLDDFNRFAIRDDGQRVRAYLHAIDKISLSTLAFENRLDYRMARSDAQMTLIALEQRRWPERNPLRYLEIIFAGLFSLLDGEKDSLEPRAVGLLGRLKAVPDALADACRNLKAPPRQFVEAALEMADARNARLSCRLPRFVAKIGDPALQKALNAASLEARQAIAEFARFLREAVLPRATPDFALGREQFDYQLRIGQLLDKERASCAGALALGREELETAKRELCKVAEAITPGRGWEAVVAELKRQHPTASGLFPAYKSEVARARNFVETRRLLTLPGEETLRVIEEEEEGSGTEARAGIETLDWARFRQPGLAYTPPAPFAARQEGVFRVARIDRAASPERQEAALQNHSFYNLPLVALREAWPGRHVQQLRACQTPSRFRRHFANSALFVEGWVRYCEAMMREQGFYDDPRVRLLQLADSLRQACRVIVDVELHGGSMALEEAARFLQVEARLEPAHALTEAKRCALAPAQSLAGLAGKRALTALRDEAQRRQGARFTLRRFHDALLSHGSLPPILLREALFHRP